jgi:glutamine cyclotransferase
MIRVGLGVVLVLVGASPRHTLAQETPVCGYEVVAVFPHDPDAFTQGLVITDGTLYEGTGLHGQSSIREVDLETGAVVQIFELDDTYFGEGVTTWGDELIQLTYTSEIGFVYDRFNFALLDEFYYSGQGWGLTQDGQRLIMSNGSADLIFRDPDTYQEIGSVVVHDHLGPVASLNELEFIKGRVYANVWYTPYVVTIDPRTGRVIARIDLSGLLDVVKTLQTPGVLNGIAYDADTDRLFVTGKNWTSLFEIELVDCPMFWDGFETGDTAAWSHQTPRAEGHYEPAYGSR